MHWVFIASSCFFPVVGSYSLVTVYRPLTVVGSLVTDFCSSMQGQYVLHRFSCLEAYGIFLEQRLNPSLLHSQWQKLSENCVSFRQPIVGFCLF